MLTIKGLHVNLEEENKQILKGVDLDHEVIDKMVLVGGTAVVLG